MRIEFVSGTPEMELVRAIIKAMKVNGFIQVKCIKEKEKPKQSSEKHYL